MAERAPDFVYSIYIGGPVERVWNALIDRDLTKKYWGHYNESDWAQGSPWRHVRTDAEGTVDIVGEVLEIDPPKRMVISWVSPENEGQDAKTSRVTIELTPNGEETLLTVTHSDLEAGSAMDKSVRKGWVVVLSNLKTQLETGEPLPGLV